MTNIISTIRGLINSILIVFYTVTMHKSKEEQANVTNSQYQRSRTCPEPHHLYLDGDMFLQVNIN